jgi:glycine oxidase
LKHSIIIGFGIAGFAYAIQLVRNNKDFVIIDLPISNSTYKSAGVINPTVLKRYTLAWNAPSFINYAKKYYSEFELKYKVKVLEPYPIHRYFSSIKEQNYWSEASFSNSLKPYLKSNFKTNSPKDIKTKFGYGVVKNSSKLKVKIALDSFKESLNGDQFINEQFDNKALILNDKFVEYKNIRANQIVFCDGIQMKKNKWFEYLPLIGSKGEMLVIKAPMLSSKKIIKGSIFVVPIMNDLFWVGSTFDNEYKSNKTTKKGIHFLTHKLNNLITVPYEIIEHNAAIRPTVIDRRPLLGSHPKHKNIYIFNGLGTRGSFMAPLLSKWLYDFISTSKKIDKEVSIERFSQFF